MTEFNTEMVVCDLTWSHSFIAFNTLMVVDEFPAETMSLTSLCGNPLAQSAREKSIAIIDHCWVRRACLSRKFPP